MAKYYGKVGFIKTEETAPGVYSEKSIERPYKGDIQRNYRRWVASSENINSNLTLDNIISIIADDFAYENTYAMRYVEFSGSFWEITNIELQRPRINLTIGGVYNRQEEPEDESTDDESTEDSEIPTE